MRKRINKVCHTCLQTYLVDIHQALCPTCGNDLTLEIDPLEVRAYILLLLLKEGVRRHREGRKK